MGNEVSLDIRPGKLPGVLLIIPQVFHDERGFFMEAFNKKVYSTCGIEYDFVQDNHSRSRKHTLRGLHYQIKHPQGKLVRAVVGEVFDVYVDLRRNSPTFGEWEGCIISAENRLQAWIPPGFAHGFYVKSEWAEIIYKTTDYYKPEFDRTLLWKDPEIGIKWPMEDSKDPLISNKDSQGRRLAEAEIYE